MAPRSCSQGFERSLTSHREGESCKRPYAQVGGGSHPQEDGRPSFSHDQADGRGSRSPDYHRRSHTRGESKPPHLRRSHVSPQPNRALQWREKSPSSLGHHQETSESSRTRRPPLERNLSTYDPPTPPPPCRRNLNPSDIISPVTVIPSKDQVLNEQREVTIQYTSCTDPTESAARKHRVFQGEARNLMSSTVDNIIAAAVASAPLVNPEGLSAQVDHQSPRISPSEDPPIPGKSSISTSKRGRGRPPLHKQPHRTSPKLLGVKTQNRNLT